MFGLFGVPIAKLCEPLVGLCAKVLITRTPEHVHAIPAAPARSVGVHAPELRVVEGPVGFVSTPSPVNMPVHVPDIALGIAERFGVPWVCLAGAKSHDSGGFKECQAWPTLGYILGAKGFDRHGFGCAHLVLFAVEGVVKGFHASRFLSVL